MGFLNHPSAVIHIHGFFTDYPHLALTDSKLKKTKWNTTVGYPPKITLHRSNCLMNPPLYMLVLKSSTSHFPNLLFP